MKSIAATAQQAAQSITQTPAGSGTCTKSDGDAASDYVNRIFAKLTALCPAWRQAVDGDATEWAGRYKAEMIVALKEAGIRSGAQVKAGLSEVRRSGTPWVPSPGQFAAWCAGAAGGWQQRGDAYQPYRRDRALEQLPDPDVVAAAKSALREAAGLRPSSQNEETHTSPIDQF